MVTIVWLAYMLGSLDGCPTSSTSVIIITAVVTVLYQSNIKRQPQGKNMTISFESRSVIIEGLNARKVISSIANDSGDVFAFLDDATLVRINISSKELTSIANLSKHAFPPSSLLELHCSKNSKFVALTCSHRGDDQQPPTSRGVVLGLDPPREILTLSNGSYHTELTPFPMCFVTHKSRNLIIHATDWNRLDITNLDTGELLTERNYEEKPDVSDHDDFVFTEWPGKLRPSPSQHRVATIGWVWHPIGVAYSFDLKRWLEGYVWESDASIHKKSYAIWDYFWDSPFEWIDDSRLCIWGVDENSMEPNESVTIFDANSGETLFRFNGPTQDIFIFDKLLFSGLAGTKKGGMGLSVWDVHTGDCLHSNEEFTFDGYSHGQHEFYKFGSDNSITFIRWHQLTKIQSHPSDKDTKPPTLSSQSA